MVDKHLANVVSNSWGMPESDASKGEVRALNSVFQQAQAQGMGIFFASGDDGDNRAAFGSVSGGFPDSSPLVTSVGGTSLAVGSSGQRLWETGWGTTEMNWAHGAWAERFPGYFLYGGGGGASAIYAKPSYQDGVVPGTQRAEPDVSLVADPQTGVLFTQTYSKPGGGTEQKESWIGGTSLSAPLMAGIATLANEAQHRPLGFLNPQLYRLAGSSAFNDITPSGRTLAVLRHRLKPNGKRATMLRSLDRDSSLATAAGLGRRHRPRLATCRAAAVRAAIVRPCASSRCFPARPRSWPTWAWTTCWSAAPPSATGRRRCARCRS